MLRRLRSRSVANGGNSSNSSCNGSNGQPSTGGGSTSGAAFGDDGPAGSVVAAFSPASTSSGLSGAAIDSGVPPMQQSATSKYMSLILAEEGTGDDDGDAGPGPAFATPTSASFKRPSILSRSSSVISANLLFSRRKNHRTVHPDSDISGSVYVASEEALGNAKLIKVILTGKASATVLGKGRWQSGIAAQAIGAGGPATAVPIIYREVHTFLRNEKILYTDIDSPEAGQPLAVSSKQLASELRPLKFDFTIDIPRIKRCTCPAKSYLLPPSVDLRNADDVDKQLDRSTIEITYSISAIMERKGLLKRDVKVKIPLTMTDDTAPGYRAEETGIARARGPLKYASDIQDPPEVEVEVSFVCPTAVNATIPYTVYYRMASGPPPFADADGSGYDRPPDDDLGMDMPPDYHPNANPLLAQLKPRVEVSLTRRCLTRPVEKPNDGVQNSFSTYMLCLGRNTGPDSMTGGNYNADRGYGEIKGELRVPRNEKSMFTCGAEIQHGIMHKPVYFYRAGQGDSTVEGGRGGTSREAV